MGGIPEHSIRHCLKAAEVELADVDVVAINSDPNANLKKSTACSKYRTSPRVLLDRLRNRSARASLEVELRERFLASPFKGK